NHMVQYSATPATRQVRHRWPPVEHRGQHSAVLVTLLRPAAIRKSWSTAETSGCRPHPARICEAQPVGVSIRARLVRRISRPGMTGAETVPCPGPEHAEE